MIRNVLYTLGSLRAALVAAVGLPFLIAAGAYAQDPNSAPNAPIQSEATTDRVIVTGSYIPTAETESALPVTVYTAEVLKKQGANTPVEGLRQLPSFIGNAATENDSNAGNGQASINLRGVGSQNVLILLNGRRAFLGQGLNGVGADINAISIGGLSRTEVLKDGASAIYGSDAVSGVVNFIMINGPGEKPYEGAELFALYGNTTDTDAHVRQVYVRGGVTGLDGKVSIAAAGEYYSRANLFSRDRRIAVTGDLSNNPTGLQQGGINNNSPTFAGRVSETITGAGQVPNPNFDPTQPVSPTNLRFRNNGRGQLVLINATQGGGVTPADYRTFDPAGGGTDPSRFNFRDFSPAIPAVEKANYFVTGRYKIFGDGMQLYGDIMYAKTKQDNGLAAAPFALPAGTTNTPLLAAATGQPANTGSRYNPFGGPAPNLNFDPTVTDPSDPRFPATIARSTQVRYRSVQELGLRRSFFDHDYYRYTAGINGDFNIKDNGFISRFGYDTGFVYERFDELRIDSGDAQFTPLAAEIAAGNFNPFIGQAAPTAGVAPTYVRDPATGAAIPFGTQAYDNTAALQRASYLGHSEFYEHDYLYDAKINAHLFPNLWNGGVDFAAGYEHRQIRLHSVPDPVQAAGDQLGFNAAPNSKTIQEVDSFFTELTVPLVTSTMNVPLVRSLEFSVAWRYEKFKDQDQTPIDPLAVSRQEFDNSNPNEDFGGTPRVLLRYQPIADITLRASWGQSFLSPSPVLLFNPVAQNFPVVFDPVNVLTLQPPDGVFQGGNPALVPEVTDSYTAGIVWTPKFLPGFTMTADWYQLYTKNLLITAAQFAQVLLSAGTIDPDGCGNGSGNSGDSGVPGGTGLGITRLNDGSLDCIDSNNFNAGKRLVQGIDVTAVYEIPTEKWGKFTFSGGWNHVFTWKASAGDTLGTHNFLGDFAATVPLAPGGIPFNKAFVRGEWEWRHWDLIGTVNYVGDYDDDPNFILGNDLVPGSDPFSQNLEFQLHRRVTSYITLDTQLSYEFVKPPTEPAPYVKESKDAKNVPVTEAATASIWQRMLWGTRLTVGCNNVFDRSPPIVLGAFNDNYDTSNYSIRGRYYYVSLNKRF
jgi:iron complex outermembrane receptor protein